MSRKQSASANKIVSCWSGICFKCNTHSNDLRKHIIKCIYALYVCHRCGNLKNRTFNHTCNSPNKLWFLIIFIYNWLKKIVLFGLHYLLKAPNICKNLL